MKAKTELELTRMEEKSLAEKLDRSMALVQLQLQASGTLKDLHEARGLVGQTEAIRYFSMSRRDLRPGGRRSWRLGALHREPAGGGAEGRQQPFLLTLCVRE